MQVPIRFNNLCTNYIVAELYADYKDTHKAHKQPIFKKMFVKHHIRDHQETTNSFHPSSIPIILRIT